MEQILRKLSEIETTADSERCGEEKAGTFRRDGETM